MVHQTEWWVRETLDALVRHGVLPKHNNVREASGKAQA